MSSNKPFYAIEKEIYFQLFEPAYRQMFTPQCLIQFPILLPFQVPFEEGGAFSIFHDDYISTFHFLTIIRQETVDGGVLGESPAHLEVHKSRVEMVYVTDKEIALDEDHLSLYFDRLLEQLNKFLLSYLIYKKDSDVYRVSKEMMQFAVMYRAIDLTPWSEKGMGLLMLHFDVPYGRETLTAPEVEQVTQYAYALTKNWNPFMTSEEIALNARRYFKDGFYRETVIFTQTSVETFLNTLYRCFLAEEGKTNKEINEIMENTAFISMVKNQFHPRIGGNWTIENSKTATGKWYTHTYKLRNRVAHGGHYPTFAEAQQAQLYGNEMRNYAITLLRKRQKLYPNTLTYLTPPPKDV